MSAEHGMSSSNMKYISVSSPYTVNDIHVPPKILLPPVSQPASWERERSSDSSAEDSQESETGSLAEERQHQLRLQHRILENQEFLGQDAGDILEGDSLEEDSLEEMSSEEKRDEYNKHKKGKQKIYGSGRRKQPVEKYSSLKYNPHWKSTKKGAEFFQAERTSQVFGGSSGDFSLDSFYLHSDGSSDNDPQEGKSQDSLSEFAPELFSFHGANVASKEPDGPQAKRREPAIGGFHSRDNPGQAFPSHNQQEPPQRAEKNFVKKNKRTLGLQAEKRNSYLELHNKKQQVLQGQVTDSSPVDEESLQSVPAFQTGKMKPEDKWCPKGQQLKDKLAQRSKPESKQTLNGRVFPRNDGQKSPGRAAEAKPWLQSLQQIPGFQAAPSAGAIPALNPSSSVVPDPEKSQTSLNNFPSSIHTDFTTPTYPPNSILTTPTSHFLPIFQNFYPPEVLNPDYPSTESKKHQHFSRDNSSSDQEHPELRNISPDFDAILQEKVKDQAPLPDFKNHIHEDNSSPTASCGRPHVPEAEEQHQPEFGDGFAGSWLWGLFPPALPQRGSQGNSGKADGNPKKMRRSNSEGSLLQMEKQSHPKGSKKLSSSKFYTNMNVKLGGLGPDYETIKEKKQKLNLQKEYSRQIKEYNMRNLTVVQRPPVKPQVSSVSRQKALEYAKKIPRPKTFIARQSEQEVQEALAQAPKGSSLPQIPSLESLWDRHKKEKEFVAAFKALRIL